MACNLCCKKLEDAYDIPIVATIHATEAGRNSGIHDETQRYINDTEWLLTYEATEVIVNSNYMKNEIQRLFGLPFDKINVIPNGINLSNFTGIEEITISEDSMQWIMKKLFFMLED